MAIIVGLILLGIIIAVGLVAAIAGSLVLGGVRRVGAIGGLVLFGAAMLGGLVDGFDRIWTWQFLVGFLAISMILEQIVRAFVGVLVLRDDI
jgi:hypothetical protein